MQYLEAHCIDSHLEERYGFAYLAPKGCPAGTLKGYYYSAVGQ